MTVESDGAPMGRFFLIAKGKNTAQADYVSMKELYNCWPRSVGLQPGRFIFLPIGLPGFKESTVTR